MTEMVRQATKIMLIRHAEKPTDDPPPYGVTSGGERESESLTVRGWQRAGALAVFFAPANGSFQNPALARPQFIYASTPTKRQGSRRSIETITPLAEKLAIRVNSNYPKLEAERMLEEAFLCAGVVLICWQHELLPKIASKILGNKTTAPHEWPEDRYDMVWVFDRDPNSDQYGFKQVPQNLLMGDWAIPIR
ncbi:MAG TPA: histidine phosphatase family protein [Pyrinomonadaceae bacterium]|nr:histidine phosphatase family protein [Pyrinomonadaceae bacterium]